MLFNDHGINLVNWKESLDAGETLDLAKFAATIREKNLRNSVFVDVTANDEVAKLYEDLLRKSISVVACNKVAASSDYEYYKSLKSLQMNLIPPFFLKQM